GTIPIVMISGSADPVGLGLIASLARPGGNVTGSSYSAGLEFAGKQLQLLTETVPEVRRVAILSNPANPRHPPAIPAVNVAARPLGVEVQLLEARGPNELAGAFVAMAKDRVAALVVVTDTVFLLHRTRLVELAVKNRLPSMYGLSEYVEAGGLMSYGPSLREFYRQAASDRDKILKGAKPADLPGVQPPKFEVVINMKTAKPRGDDPAVGAGTRRPDHRLGRARPTRPKDLRQGEVSSGRRPRSWREQCRRQ